VLPVSEEVIIETINCNSLSLELNYLDKNPKRYINLISEEYSIYADLISNKYNITLPWLKKP
jgi:hypothetical protein